MNLSDRTYTRFALCREMLETPDLIRSFDESSLAGLSDMLRDAEGLLLTGEGSSRIFPAKRARARALRGFSGTRIPLTEGARQSMDYELGAMAVLGASNSGRTRELVNLFAKLGQEGHARLAGICANRNTPLEELADTVHILGCGQEQAVAATKSVVEQAMVYQSLLEGESGSSGKQRLEEERGAAARAFGDALELDVPKDMSESLAGARTIYFAGRNDGVAEELTLKTNEIVRKSADFLEGTYAAHGIEEIMQPRDVMVLVDPFEEEEEKLQECIQKAVGVKIVAISDRNTRFPTLVIPATEHWNEFVQLAAGWNLLVEAGLAAGVNMDTTERARKVGNEVQAEAAT